MAIPLSPTANTSDGKTPGVLSESADSMTVIGPSGEPITVAKAALSPEALDRIKRQAASSWQHFAPSSEAGALGSAPSLVPTQQPQPATPQESSPPIPVSAPPPPSKPQVGSGGSGRMGSDENELRAGFNAEADAQRQMADVQAKVAEERGAILRGQLEADQKAAAELAKVTGEHQRRVDEGLAKLQKAESDFAQAKVDPSRYWSEKSTGTKILAAIAAGLGGFGAGLNGGPNTAANIIQSAVQDDIRAQEGAIAQKGQAIQHAHGALTMARQLYGDKVEQLKAAEVIGLRQAQTQLELMMNKYKAPELQAQLSETIAQLKIKEATAMQGLHQRLDENARGWAQINIQRDESRAKSAAAEAKGTANPEFLVPGVGYAVNKEARTTVAESTVAYRQAKELIGKLRKFRETYGNEKFDRTALSAARVSAKQLQNKLRIADRMGTMDKGTQDMLESIVGSDPGAVELPGAIGSFLARLNAVEDDLETGYRSTVEANIATPLQKSVRFRGD